LAARPRPGHYSAKYVLPSSRPLRSESIAPSPRLAGWLARARSPRALAAGIRRSTCTAAETRFVRRAVERTHRGTDWLGHAFVVGLFLSKRRQPVATTRVAPPAAFRRVLLTWLPAWLSRMQCAPSADRNKAPIAAVLAKYAPFAGSKPATLLEVASGTGQHAAHLAEAFPHVVWQPTEFAGGSAGPESPAYGDLSPVFASVVAYTAGMENVRPPLALDASAGSWPAPIESATFDAIFACNILHISPYAVTEGLLAGAARLLVPGSGVLCVYGPFMVDGEHTSGSNAALF
jgi:SAM-dependent methyltransferase